MTDILVLDPGHGAPDNGARGNGLIEKDINLDLALKTTTKAKEIGVTCFTTRSTDNNLTLAEAGETSDLLNADFVVAIHCDASKDPKEHGARCYYFPGSRNGKTLAREIYKRLPTCLKFGDEMGYLPADKDIFPRAYNVLQSHKAPTVVLECCYLSNKHDAEFILYPLVQAGIVDAILEGFQSACQKMVV